MWQVMKHLQVFLTSALSTPSSSSECDIAYIPPKPNHWFYKQWNKNNKKTASDCYRSTSHNLNFQWIMSWIDSLKLLRKDFNAIGVSAYCFLHEKHKPGGSKKKQFPHERRKNKNQVPGYVFLHKTKSQLLHGEKMYIHLAVTVQAVAIPLKKIKNMSLFFPTKQKPSRCHFIYISHFVSSIKAIV